MLQQLRKSKRRPLSLVHQSKKLLRMLCEAPLQRTTADRDFLTSQERTAKKTLLRKVWAKTVAAQTQGYQIPAYRE